MRGAADEAKQQQLLQPEPSDQNRDGNGPDHIAERQRSSQDPKNLLVEVKVSQIKIEEKKEKAESKIEEKCRGKKNPEAPAELPWE